MTKPRVPATERRLFAAAEDLCDFADAGHLIAELIEAAQAAGVDPRVVPGLRATLALLIPGADISYDPAIAGEPGRAGPGAFRSDLEMVEAVVETEMELQVHLEAMAKLTAKTEGAAEDAADALDLALKAVAACKKALRAAKNRPVKEPCTGCHADRARGIREAELDLDAAEDAVEDAAARLSLCCDILEILEEAAGQLATALTCLMHVIPDLSEAFELITEYIRRGGRLARDADRFHTGQLRDTAVV